MFLTVFWLMHISVNGEGGGGDEINVCMLMEIYIDYLKFK